ncbi:MAG: cadmium-translocating P-type ATPase [Ruminococcus sp.]|nr:cadmium-translocating P-type ATPase [Ruminococcus sp.]
MKKLKVRGELSDELLQRINETARSIEPDVEIVRSGHRHKHHHDNHHEHGEHCECGHEHHHEHGEHCECGHEHHHEHEEHESLHSELILLIFGILLFAGALLTGHFLDIMPLTVGLYVLAYIILGSDILLKTAKNIRSRNFFDENTLMTVATLGAFAIGEFAEAVGVVLFFRIGEIFEDFAVSHSRKAITETASLKVTEADVLRGEDFVRVDADEICAGDLLRIKPGERIAADGIIESGKSYLDVSAINGEPVPVRVEPGNGVVSGSINTGDVILVRATAAADESMIAKVARAIEEASAAKPKIDRFITRFARIYTPIVIAAAFLTAIIPPLFTGEWTKWIHSALTFLVISCPCALVLSVPLAYFSGIGAASKLGILFKGGDSIEALGRVKAIAFDKTGTLTDGSFSVTEVHSFGSLSDNELLALCGNCEQISTHPVAESIVEHCRRENITLLSPETAGETAAMGVSAVLGGKTVLCGNERLMTANSIVLPRDITAAGSVVYISVNGRAEGAVIVSDTVKKTAAKAVEGLNKRGIATAMLTGDKQENADIMGNMLGIGTVRGGLLPDGKLAELEALRGRYGSVMFVGDGINDGPVLAGADVGGAMQTGSDLALETADTIFMNSEPESVLRAKRIADKALRVSYENIIFALAVKAAVLVLGLLGHPNMWLAVFADSGTAMLLVLNSVRILNTNAYTK